MNSLKESYKRGSKKPMYEEKEEKGEMGGKELKRVTIEESDNDGFFVRCEYEMPHKKGKEGSDMPMGSMSYEETKKVFANSDDLMSFLDDLYG